MVSSVVKLVFSQNLARIAVHKVVKFLCTFKFFIILVSAFIVQPALYAWKLKAVVVLVRQPGWETRLIEWWHVSHILYLHTDCLAPISWVLVLWVFKKRWIQCWRPHCVVSLIKICLWKQKSNMCKLCLLVVFYCVMFYCGSSRWKQSCSSCSRKLSQSHWGNLFHSLLVWNKSKVNPFSFFSHPCRIFLFTGAA